MFLLDNVGLIEKNECEMSRSWQVILFMIHLTTLTVASDNRLINERWIEKDMEGGGPDIFLVLSRHSQEGTEENHENLFFKISGVLAEIRSGYFPNRMRSFTAWANFLSINGLEVRYKKIVISEYLITETHISRLIYYILL
jgi:hypothetical protein